jgi:hypothetical protein
MKSLVVPSQAKPVPTRCTMTERVRIWMKPQSLLVHMSIVFHMDHWQLTGARHLEVTESQAADKQPLSVLQADPTALCTHILLTQEPSQLASVKQSPHLPVAVSQMVDMQAVLLLQVAPEAQSASAAHGIS